MTDARIENPIINSPFEPPQRHFHFSAEGISNEIQHGRRESVYFVPIPKPKGKRASQQLALDAEPQNQYKPNQLINDIRERVKLWSSQNWPGITSITRALLDYWKNESRDRRLFFCQIEALETWIYLTEIAPTKDANIGTHLLGRLEAENRNARPESSAVLHRRAAKMATGSGKTVVMAMLIAWQALNKIHNRRDKRFTDNFLLVSPGITIRDRLRVLLPSDPNSYYQQLDIIPQTYLSQLAQAKIEIINYHAFMLREKGDGAKLTKQIAGIASKETTGQMVSRVCKGLSRKNQLIVINDEAHHCYHFNPKADTPEKLSAEEKKQAKQNEQQARVWIATHPNPYSQAVS